MTALDFVALVATPFFSILVVGVINRVKSRWSGRKGPPILQLAYDIQRLMRKRSVFSATTSIVFRLAPYVVLVTAVASALIAPVFATKAPISFAFDFVFFAYVWGLGRVALILGALDTGSSFEGMGASREATFSTMLEPAFFLVFGALSTTANPKTLDAALHFPLASGASLSIWLASIVALTIIVQVEAARMPVDDPSTHLELTMIHEVMILDHSGRELAALQLGSALKLTVGVSMIATLLNPLAHLGSSNVASILMNALISLVIAVAIGTTESLIARLRLRAIPIYVLVALIAGGVALLSTTWSAAQR